MRGLIATTVVFCSFTPALQSADWPQFRGPTGDGRATTTAHLPTRWGGLLSAPLWQTTVPGTGWSSPIIVKDRIWLTAAEQTALSEEERTSKLAKNKYGTSDFQVHGSVTLFALEFDATNGTMLRRIELFTDQNPRPIHLANTYASPTPVIDGKRLYCHFGSLGTAAVDLESGEVVWRQHFVVDDITGPGSSPVLCNGLVILTCDGADDQFVVALDGQTGDIAWRTSRPPIEATDGISHRAFSTPLLIEDNGRQQLIAPGAQWTVSYDPANGHELWRVNFGTGHAVVARPVYADGIVYVCSGFPQHDMWAVRVNGSGDVTNSHVVWKFTKQAPELSSPVVVDHELYFATTTGIATCLDAKTGAVVWQHRLGGNFTASPLAADGKLYFTNQSSTTTVIHPGREYEELARNELFGQTLASMAVCGDALVIRTDLALYCIQEQ